ncbi:hypothetical protein HYX12_03795 [Candidatus Woesearchaeota archaeon]|nr:hypothetical protein [Candidatus Woesearchaeota archaeon]
MKKIILDTNSLMAVSEFKIDIFSEIERVCYFPFQLSVLEGTIIELKKIMDVQRGKYKRGAKLALDLLKAKKVRIMAKPEAAELRNVDDQLVEHSKQGEIILTQDKELKKRLYKPYLTIRQKNRVILVD